MNFISHKGIINNEVAIPASKSYFQRAVALSLFADKTLIDGYTTSSDSDISLKIIESLGAKIFKNGSQITIHGTNFLNQSIQINCGESGLSTRMFAPILALNEQEVELIGEGSILNRSMTDISEALTKMGKAIQLNKNEFLPLLMSGKLIAGEYEIDGSKTSQVITGLLIALCFAEGTSLLKISNLKSRPYIDMTLAIIKQFGLVVEEKKKDEFFIKGQQKINSTEYMVEGDWSGAAAWCVAAAIAGKIKLTNLNPHSKQADKAILDVLRLCGATFQFEHDNLIVEKNELNAFEFDATDCPDLFPVLAALASQCQGKSLIKGIHRLINKESNRAESIKTELNKLNIPIKLIGDEMIIEGPTQLVGAKCHSHNDHRIVMMLAILGLVSEQGIEIEKSEAINKSYPEFLNELDKMID